MKKFLLFISAILLVQATSFAASADGDLQIRLRIGNIAVYPGEACDASVSIECVDRDEVVRNMLEYVAFQFDMRLPEGVEIFDAIPSDNLPPYSCRVVELEDNLWRVLGYLTDPTTETDDVLDLTFEVAEWAVPGDYTVDITHVRFSNRYGSDIFAEDSGFNFEILSEEDITGIANVDMGAEGAVYYNLSGCRINNPEHGIFIKVSNGKASKVIF